MTFPIPHSQTGTSVAIPTNVAGPRVRHDGLFHPITWILVANANHATIVEDAHGRALMVVQVLRHAEPRAQRRAGDADRRGSSRRPDGAPTTLEQRTDALHKARDQFASKLAGVLAQAYGQGRFARLVVAAASPMYGVLNKHLRGPVAGAVRKSIERDLSHVPLGNLRERLARA